MLTITGTLHLKGQYWIESEGIKWYSIKMKMNTKYILCKILKTGEGIMVQWIKLLLVSTCIPK